MSADLPLIALGGLIGGFVNGLAGFGTALFALGIWLNVLPPEQAVALSVVVSATTGLQGLWIVRREIRAQRRRLLRFLLPALLGLPAGFYALGLIRPDGLKLLIAAFLLGYGLFFILRGALPQMARPTPVLDRGVGLISGVLGGLAGMSGALLVIWCALRPWPKAETRAVLQPFNFVTLVIMASVFAARGTYTAELLPKLAVALLSSLLAAQLGVFAFRRLSDAQFRWLIVGLMTLSGAALLARTVL